MIAGIAMICLVGAMLLPWQIALDKRSREAGFRNVAIDLSLREQVGQSGFLAALSGFRSPLASLLWIRAYIAWENAEWGRMAALFDTVTTLQPHTLLYWDIAAWHMAWNASIAALQDTKQPSQALRERASRQYIDLGRDILERGIRNNPNNYYLYERLGILLRDKVKDHEAAAEAFARAASFSDAPPYIKRFAAYELANVPGREREAYEKLLSLYKMGERERLPTLMGRLRALEEKLQVPASERVGSEAPFLPAVSH
jgi:tetratricopeptide (TPR) repeat protein